MGRPASYLNWSVVSQNASWYTGQKFLEHISSTTFDKTLQEWTKIKSRSALQARVGP
jgi:hypothetical protein